MFVTMYTMLEQCTRLTQGSQLLKIWKHCAISWPVNKCLQRQFFIFDDYSVPDVSYNVFDDHFNIWEPDQSKTLNTLLIFPKVVAKLHFEKLSLAKLHLANFILQNFVWRNFIWQKYFRQTFFTKVVIFLWQNLSSETKFGETIFGELHLANFIWGNFVWQLCISPGLTVPILSLASLTHVNFNCSNLSTHFSFVLIFPIVPNVPNI